ncbi:MAG TPA: bifunctional precorrin-2 dehydrogenase/sirohydrochlorin ferrochelatase [Desulfuromonadaceae bacterium]|jgi:precorrin-2 dehydrogenase/sirohydrochlorin ferrochelatase
MPLQINLHGKKVVIAGGGRVAARKMQMLLKTDAIIRIIAPILDKEIATLSASGAISTRIGEYCAADLEGAFLVVAATDDSTVNSRVAADARQAGILVAVTDAPELGNCTFPAILRRGDLQVSVATGGRCPAFAVVVRDFLAKIIGDNYGIALEQLAAEREKLLTEGNSNTYNSQFIRLLAARLIDELSEHKESP